MYIFFEDKTIIFTGTDSSCEGCDHVINVSPGETIRLAKVLQNLENSKRMCIKAQRPEKVFSEFCSQLTEVDAAGGLVSNPAGETLMICRNSRWDLPKGHREQGETMAECARREVMEECGILELEVGGHLTDTLHFYQAAGRWILKRTAWFPMKTGQRELVPQTEEGISSVQWVGRDDVAEKLSNTYSSIREVFRAAGYITPENEKP